MYPEKEGYIECTLQNTTCSLSSVFAGNGLNSPDIVSIGKVDPSLVRLLLNLDRLGDARPENGAFYFKHALQEIGFEKHQKHL